MDPISIMALIGAGSSIFKGIGAFGEGRRERNTRMFDAKQMELRGEEILIAGLDQSNQRKRMFDDMMASNLVRGGPDPYSSASFLAMERRANRDLELDLMNIETESRRGAIAERIGASSERSASRAALTRGSMQMVGSLFNAGGKIFGGVVDGGTFGGMVGGK